ncbi:MAG: nuclear transport factor 2 family protein, partial [Anaerolineae bacterium]|nr:nuclear transport factor 2 family protein [Anaerolineae bacterium]
LLLIAALLLLGACAADVGDPAAAVERYLQAKVTGDASTVQALLCLSMEADLNREASSFSSVTDARIEDMTCQRVGSTDTVQCTGQIVATYGTEATTFPLTTYQVVQEDGEWKWCGEAG